MRKWSMAGIPKRYGRNPQMQLLLVDQSGRDYDQSGCDWDLVTASDGIPKSLTGDRQRSTLGSGSAVHWVRTAQYTGQWRAVKLGTIH